MKYISILFLIFIAPNEYAQRPVVDSSHINMILLQDSIRELNNKIDLLQQHQGGNQELENSMNQASTTIENQSSLINAFGILYSIITIIIALIGIVLPILIYQFGIKPSQDALKEFDKNAEIKMAQFISKTRNDQIDEAIKNITSESHELKTNGLSYLSLTQYQGFTDEQLFRIYMLLKSDDIDQNTKTGLSYILCNKKSDYATEYFTNLLFASDDLVLKYPALRYFLITTQKDYLALFSQLISKAKDKKMEFLHILGSANAVNKTSMIALLNHEQLINNLDEKALTEISKSLLVLGKTWNLTEEILHETYLSKKIKSTIAE